jgi:alkaline phosphatase
VPTLLEQMKAAGYGTGVVTTTRITHATPAATYAHICHRDGENAIAAQLVPKGAGFNGALTDGVDVIFGGGRQHFLATAGGKRTDGRDLVGEFKTATATLPASRTSTRSRPAPPRWWVCSTRATWITTSIAIRRRSRAWPR